VTGFTPVSGLVGGILIGAAVSMFVLLNGRVAGISGILGGALKPSRGDFAWRIAFLAGLIAGPLAVAVANGRVPDIVMQASDLGLVIAGLLVGFGTQLGGGCTSGHGVCGIARGSPRSLAATATFFAVAAATVFLVRHAGATP
jgi:uncharacterized membrane protein YedE/YeeE